MRGLQYHYNIDNGVLIPFPAAARRLNFRLSEACGSSMKELCGDVGCQEHAPCGGAMLRCLTKKAEYIVVPECQHVSMSKWRMVFADSMGLAL